MIKFNAINIDASPSNDDGLALVYFEFENFNYFTICFNEEEQEEIYIEFSEQAKSVYSNKISYSLIGNSLVKFELSEQISKKLDIDKVFEISFGCDSNTFELLEQSLIAVFKHIS